MSYSAAPEVPSLLVPLMPILVGSNPWFSVRMIWVCVPPGWGGGPEETVVDGAPPTWTMPAPGATVLAGAGAPELFLAALVVVADERAVVGVPAAAVVVDVVAPSPAAAVV